MIRECMIYYDRSNDTCLLINRERTCLSYPYAVLIDRSAESQHDVYAWIPR